MLDYNLRKPEEKAREINNKSYSLSRIWKGLCLFCFAFLVLADVLKLTLGLGNVKRLASILWTSVERM